TGDPGPLRRRDLHQHLPTVTGVTHPPDVAEPLQPVDHPGDGTSGQAGELGDAAGRVELDIPTTRSRHHSSGPTVGIRPRNPIARRSRPAPIGSAEVLPDNGNPPEISAPQPKTVI